MRRSRGLARLAFPRTAPPWPWLIAFGMRTGALFLLAMTLSLDVLDEPAEATRFV